ncbi:RHS repeat-associated protein [Pseudomonas sp. Y3 TE3536]
MTKATASKRFYFYQRAKVATVKETERNRTLFSGGDGPLAELLSNDADQAQLLATESTGSVIRAKHTDLSEPLVYTAYGHSSSLPSELTSAGFNGEFFDALEFYLLGAGYRLYYPPLMRLFSPDNLSPFAQGGINSYAYCGGDPVNFTDPSGHTRGSSIFGISLPNFSRRRSTDSTAQLLRYESSLQFDSADVIENTRVIQLNKFENQINDLNLKLAKNTTKLNKADTKVQHYDRKLEDRTLHNWGWNNRKRDDAIARRRDYRAENVKLQKELDRLKTFSNLLQTNTDVRRNSDLSIKTV